MIEVAVPGMGKLNLTHLVLDYNGTLARDGHLLEGVEARLAALAGQLAVHVVTADTFGKAREELADIPCELVVLSLGPEDAAKRDYVKKLGSAGTVAIGNGRNDCLMLEEAVLGMALVQEEGAALRTLLSADLVLTDIQSALDLLLHPLRLVASLRS